MNPEFNVLDTGMDLLLALLCTLKDLFRIITKY